jgi:hypothetical protein
MEEPQFDLDTADKSARLTGSYHRQQSAEVLMEPPTQIAATIADVSVRTEA